MLYFSISKHYLPDVLCNRFTDIGFSNISIIFVCTDFSQARAIETRLKIPEIYHLHSDNFIKMVAYNSTFSSILSQKDYNRELVICQIIKTKSSILLNLVSEIFEAIDLHPYNFRQWNGDWMEVIKPHKRLHIQKIYNIYIQ